MPPIRHSTSTAHKDSDQIPSDQNYTLGDYSFRIERTSVPGSTNDKIEAICTKDGQNARKSIQIPSSDNVESWYVEANETEATVYAVVKIPKGGDEKQSPFGDFGWSLPIVYNSGSVSNHDEGIIWECNDVIMFQMSNETPNYVDKSFMVSSNPNTVGKLKERIWTGDYKETNVYMSYNFTYDGKTAYYSPSMGGQFGPINGAVNYHTGKYDQQSDGKAAWTALYGIPVGPTEYDYQEMIVGRFAIDLEDAGGVGPGSDWTDPGDYDPDWEPDDPTHTLYVTVTGALSGRHNDPIVDPSYSYIPADKDTVKDYGCGGDGGHGGGGGAGASTVVIHKFATNQANSKEVTAIARRHGYGSGGGKGGKGGDGCILVYY